jgi:hypothetical protein
MRLLARLRRFVDWDFATSGVQFGNASLLVLGALWLPAIAARGSEDWWIRVGSLMLAAICSLIWMSFVLWRGWRLFRASAFKGDRRYDRETRLELPPEYRDTESATKASRSRREG